VVIATIKLHPQGKEELAVRIMAQLTDIARFFKQSFETEDLTDLAHLIIHNFYDLTITDIALFVKFVKLGSMDTPLGSHHLHDGQLFGKLSPAHIIKWLGIYHGAKAEMREYLYRQAAKDSDAAFLQAARQTPELLEAFTQTVKNKHTIISPSASEAPERPLFDLSSPSWQMDVHRIWQHGYSETKAALLAFAEAEGRQDVLDYIETLNQPQ
jgi:hypothetical protein